MFMKEKEKLDDQSICSASSLSLFASCCLPVKKRMRIVQLEHDCEKKNDSILFLLSSHEL